MINKWPSNWNGGGKNKTTVVTYLALPGSIDYIDSDVIKSLGGKTNPAGRRYIKNPKGKRIGGLIFTSNNKDDVTDIVNKKYWQCGSRMTIKIGEPVFVVPNAGLLKKYPNAVGVKFKSAIKI
tara:strand:+ start:499 stop:867 length:369 start_codon:yes stop_codon:yes gene_type:complete